MTARITPGRRLRHALDAAAVTADLEFSGVELAVTLPTIEATADRIEMLRSKLAAEAERDGPLAVRAVQVAGELRQLEAQLGRLVTSLGLDVDDEDDPAPPRAGATRRDRRSHRRVPA